MLHVQSRMMTLLSLFAIAGSPALSAEPPSETQLERLMETASQTPDRPDHAYSRQSQLALRNRNCRTEGGSGTQQAADGGHQGVA